MNKPNYKYIHDTNYLLNEELCEIIEEELVNLKRNKRIDEDKTHDDTFVNEFGHVYVADFFTDYVEENEVHGFHYQVHKKPDFENALLLVTSSRVKELLEH